MAAQSFGLHSHIMAPQITGYSMPNISVIAVFIMSSSLEKSDYVQSLKLYFMLYD
jgi:hypothetical protein